MSPLGVENLSNAELLAVLLRTGTRGTNSLEMARNILRTSEQEEDNILAVHQLTMEKLKAIKGIGTVKATQILCLSELAKRLSKASVKESLILRLRLQSQIIIWKICVIGSRNT